MKRRNLFLMFILIEIFRIVYLLVWIYSIQSDMKYRLQKSQISGGLTIFLMIITLGIYGIVWQWNICKQLESIGGTDKRIITLIFSIFLFGIIINPLLIQSSVNSINTLMF